MAAKKKVANRKPIVLKTSGKGLWSTEAREVVVTDFDIGWVSDEDWDDEVHGELRVLFDATSWKVNKHGLIYTDPCFLKELRALLRKMGLKGEDVHYTEQGMQGHNYVSLGFGKKFYRSWQKQFNITSDYLAVLRDRSSI
jgi:hypothetical protein